MDTTIKQAIAAVGSQAALARAVNVPACLVWQWATGRRPVAAKHWRAIAKASGISVHVLAPEIFGEEPTADLKEAA